MGYTKCDEQEGKNIWHLNYQPDAPDTIWFSSSREHIRRLRTCSLGQCHKKKTLYSGAFAPNLIPAVGMPSVTPPTLPRCELRAALEQCFVTVAVAGPPPFEEDESSVGISRRPLSLFEARLAVESRRRTQTPMVAHTGALALALEHDADLCNLVPAVALQQIVAALPMSSSFVAYADLEASVARAIIGRPSDVAPEAHAGELGKLQCFLSQRFSGSRSAAVQAAWGGIGVSVGATASAEDQLLSLADWQSFLISLGWPSDVVHASRMAAHAYTEADWRGQGRVPAAELIADEVRTCRRWLVETLGDAGDLQVLLDSYLVHRTARQRKKGLVASSQWRCFLMHNCWPYGQALANACFDVLDIKSSGEVRSAVLVGPMACVCTSP